MAAARTHAPQNPTAFLPMSRAEMIARGWDELDVLIITGDAYVDHPSFGAALVGRVLEAAGYLVGIIAQPDWRNGESIRAMGRPRLFVGVTAGNLDSMLSNYTAARHKRKEDVYLLPFVPGSGVVREHRIQVAGRDTDEEPRSAHGSDRLAVPPIRLRDDAHQVARRLQHSADERGAKRRVI